MSHFLECDSFGLCWVRALQRFERSVRHVPMYLLRGIVPRAQDRGPCTYQCKNKPLFKHSAAIMILLSTLSAELIHFEMIKKSAVEAQIRSGQ